jgi:hypothetical protein
MLECAPPCAFAPLRRLRALVATCIACFVSDSLRACAYAHMLRYVHSCHRIRISTVVLTLSNQRCDDSSHSLIPSQQSHSPASSFSLRVFGCAPPCAIAPLHRMRALNIIQTYYPSTFICYWSSNINMPTDINMLLTYYPSTNIYYWSSYINMPTDINIILSYYPSTHIHYWHSCINIPTDINIILSYYPSTNIYYWYSCINMPTDINIILTYDPSTNTTCFIS